MSTHRHGHHDRPRQPHLDQGRRRDRLAAITSPEWNARYGYKFAVALRPGARRQRSSTVPVRRDDRGMPARPADRRRRGGRGRRERAPRPDLAHPLGRRGPRRGLPAAHLRARGARREHHAAHRRPRRHRRPPQRGAGLRRPAASSAAAGRRSCPTSRRCSRRARRWRADARPPPRARPSPRERRRRTVRARGDLRSRATRRRLRLSRRSASSTTWSGVPSDRRRDAVLVGTEGFERGQLARQERRRHEVARARREPPGELVGGDDQVHEAHAAVGGPQDVPVGAAQRRAGDDRRAARGRHRVADRTQPRAAVRVGQRPARVHGLDVGRAGAGRRPRSSAARAARRGAPRSSTSRSRTPP